MPADPILDQLAAIWRDMDTGKRRAVVMHGLTMRAALTIHRLCIRTLVEEFGIVPLETPDGMFIPMRAEQAAMVAPIGAELAEANRVAQQESMALLQHLVDSAEQAAAFRSPLARWWTGRVDTDMLDRLIARAETYVDSEGD